MTALVRLPHRESLRAVLVVRRGPARQLGNSYGWCVGIGKVASGCIEGERQVFTDAATAERAALALADEHDLIAVLA